MKILKIISTIFLKFSVPTVEDFNPNLFQGKWYQVATSRSTKLFGTGPDYTNVTALYSLENNTNITVFNEGYDSNNIYKNISGVSYTEDPLKSSQRKLMFNNIPFIGNYWIVKLGPIQNKQYEYAVVSGPIWKYFGSRFSLYILARNRKRYKEKYEKNVKKWCKENGFNTLWNCYISTN